MIALNSVSKVHGATTGRRRVLDGVNVEFQPHRHYVILGGRGSGKTTLLRLISGVTVATKGTIDRRGSISLPVGSATSFASGKTGRELATFMASLYDTDAKEVIDFTIAFANLGEVIDLPVTAMSAPLRALLSYSLGYAIPCDYYLFDDSIAYGEETVRKACWDAFQARRQTSGTIVATRDVRNAERLGEIGGVLHDGQLHMFESVAEALEVYHCLDLGAKTSGRAYAQALAAKAGPESAYNYLKQHLQENEDDAEAYEMLAALSLRLGAHSDAVTASAWALDRGSISPGMHMILAKVAESKGAFLDAIGHAENVLKVTPDHREARVMIARSHEGLKNYEEAAAMWETLSDHGSALRSYLRAEAWAPVLNTVDVLLADQPGDVRLIITRARALLELKRWPLLTDAIALVAKKQPQEALNLLYRVVRTEDWSVIPTILRDFHSDLSANYKTRNVDLILRLIERYAVTANVAGRQAEAKELFDLVALIDTERSVLRQSKGVSTAPVKRDMRDAILDRGPITAEEIVKELYELKIGRSAVEPREFDERSRAVWVAAKAFLVGQQSPSPDSSEASGGPKAETEEPKK
jgi:capsular polysaccharide transport system ATP-binding protein